MKNVYKYLNVFRCIHESHRKFRSKISVYHVLYEKKCFPEGCFYFKWYCRKLNKGHRCPRKFKHVGKNCFGCRDFYEEKVHNFPEVILPENEYDKFREELDEFEEWLDGNLDRSLEFAGIIDGIKPHYCKKIYPKSEHLSFQGFLLIFREIFLGMTRFEDFVYARISSKTFSTLKLGKGDKIFARGVLTMEEGRLVLSKCHHFEVEERGEVPVWNESNTRIIRETATRFSVQPEGCVACPFGALVDVEDFKGNRKLYRELYCLKGMPDYRDCFIPAEICLFQLKNFQ